MKKEIVGTLVCMSVLFVWNGRAPATTAIVNEQGTRYILQDGSYLTRTDGKTFSEADTQCVIVRRYTIDNFDVKRALSLRNASIAAWSVNPADDTQQCRFSYEHHDVNAEPYGQAIKIRYDVESRGRAVNGFLLKVTSIDVHLFDYVSFFLQGDSYYGFTDRMKIGFKNEKGEQVEYPISGITSEWQQYLISLDEIKNKLQWATITEIYTAFESDFVTKDKGVLYLDQLEYLAVQQ